MDRAAFVDRYKAVFEHSPWVAARAFEMAEGELLERFAAVLHAASDAEQLGLIRAHPELAANIDLTADSAAEQQGAGLRAISADEFERFSRLNRAYREKFGFPFVICVRNHTKSSILAAFEARLANGEAVERAAAVREILEIARLRLEALT